MAGSDVFAHLSFNITGQSFELCDVVGVVGPGRDADLRPNRLADVSMYSGSAI